jgi:hypothetical protein
MDFLKRQLFLIICAVVAVGSIALGVVGFQSMSEVTDRMEDADRLASKLPGLGRDAANKRAIDAQQARIDALQSYYEQSLEWAFERNRMEPLLPDCFPDPDRDRRLAFREAYFARFEELLERLNAGSEATAVEIEDAAEQIREEEEADRFFGVDRAEADASGEGGRDEEEQAKRYPSGLLTDYGASQSPSARANLIKARGMLCYATLATFEVFGSLGEGIAPEADLMWDAQLSLWIQEMVVDDLARVNDTAAEEIRQSGRTPWVGLMPVKELISIRTTPYINPDAVPKAPARPYDAGPAEPPGSGDETFTHTVSNDLYEVVQFTLKMVVDARMIPTIVDELCKDNFHTLLRIAYEDLSKDSRLLDMDGKIYGSDPTVRIVMDFETVFFGELYRGMMPEVIRDALGLPPLEEEE